MAEDNAGPCKGSVIGTVANGKQSIQYFGKIRDQWSKAVMVPDAGTLWSLGSCTKSFTATLFGLQATQGFSPVSPKQLLYPLIQPYLGGVSVPSALEQITLEQLASMTAGLLDIPPGKPRDEMATLLKALTVPGNYRKKTFKYSDLSFALLSFAAVAYAGSPPSSANQLPQAVLALLDSDILQPLGMPSATFYPPAQSASYNFPFGNSATGQTNGSKDNWPPYDGAGALYMTALDLMTWLTANMAGAAGPLGFATTFVQSNPRPTNGYPEGQFITRGWFTNTFTAKSGQSITMVTKNGDIPGFHCGIAFQQPTSPGGVSDYGVFVAFNHEQKTIPVLQQQLESLIGG